MTFFYVVSIVFHTSVPALRKCMDTSRKKVFLLRMQPLVHRLLHLFVGPERLAFHRLFEWSKDVKITWGQGLASTADVEDTRRIDLWIAATVERAVWCRALSCCNKTPVLRSPRRLDLMAGSKRFLRRSAYVTPVTVSP